MLPVLPRRARVSRRASPLGVVLAATLGALNDKIELNRRMNKTLEAMARAMRLAVEAGRLARGAGRIPRREHAVASSSFEGLASWADQVL